MKIKIGVVIIGRNEGERLKRCFESVIKQFKENSGNIKNIVYVDSGSTDGSIMLAKKCGISFVELDMTIPFSAARGRNAGFDFLINLNPKIDYVQFIDGDCQLIDGWLKAAFGFLYSQNSYAVVCGFLKEQFPDKSVYNRLCSIEWDSPSGDVESCGGIFMIRAYAYKEIGGMNPSVIAGEESEMCIRLRLLNWKIYKLNHEMAWHDAGMTKFIQWWKRAKRTGYAYALGTSIHGKSRFRHNIKQRRSSLIWGFGIPIIIIFISVYLNIKFLFLFNLYILLIARLYLRFRKQNMRSFDALLFATNCNLAKFPQAAGCIKFQVNQFLRRKNKIIEYK